MLRKLEHPSAGVNSLARRAGTGERSSNPAHLPDHVLTAHSGDLNIPLAAGFIAYSKGRFFVVQVRAFRALRYSNIAPDEMGEVSSPPYDVFTSEIRRSFYERHPLNIVRLIQGEILEGEHGDAGRVGRAVEYLKEWRGSGQMTLDDTPALYPYRQRFTLPDGTNLERNAFFAAVKLEPYGAGEIHPHEQTFPKPKGYLFDLWGRSGAHLGPIFSFYDEPRETANHALKNADKGAPIADFEDAGVRHTLWRCDDPDVIAIAQESLRDREAFIADGHHRYETSLDLRDAALAGGAPEGGEADYTLMCLANIADPGMVILPTYRLLKKVSATTEEALAALAGKYDILEEAAPEGGAGSRVAERLSALSGANGGASVFCLYDGGANVRYLIGRHNADAASVEEAVAALDVSRLHADIMDGAFQASHEEGDIAFTPDPEMALSCARNGECAVAVLLNPTPLESVCEIAKAGGKMPHKSTYFYPKVRTGLVVHAFAPPAGDSS